MVERQQRCAPYWRGYSRGYSRSTQRVRKEYYKGTQGYLTDTRAYSEVLKGTLGVPQALPRTSATALQRHGSGHGTLGTVVVTAGTDGICRSATTDECARVPAWVGTAGVGRHRRRGRHRRVAAGVTWSLVTSNAPWAGRHSHTTVIDAAGTMYLIGGFGGATGNLNDVWSSANKGANRTQGGTIVGTQGGTQTVLKGYARGTKGTLQLYIYMYIYMYVCISIYFPVYMCVCVCVWLCVCTYTFRYTCYDLSLCRHGTGARGTAPVLHRQRHCHGTLGTAVVLRGLTVFIDPLRQTNSRVCRRGRHRPRGRHRRRAAGVTWSVVTSNAPWAARSYHTTVIDAAGTMYLIGGDGCARNDGGTGFCNDVWQSPDKGASRTRGGTPGGTTAILKGHSVGGY